MTSHSTPAVLRSDFWRYLVLATEGGVYADSDVNCLRPMSTWADDPSWNGNRYLLLPSLCTYVELETEIGRAHV